MVVGKRNFVRVNLAYNLVVPCKPGGCSVLTVKSKLSNDQEITKKDCSVLTLKSKLSNDQAMTKKVTVQSTLKNS